MFVFLGVDKRTFQINRKGIRVNKEKRRVILSFDKGSFRKIVFLSFFSGLLLGTSMTLPRNDHVHISSWYKVLGTTIMRLRVQPVTIRH